MRRGLRSWLNRFRCWHNCLASGERESREPLSVIARIHATLKRHEFALATVGETESCSVTGKRLFDTPRTRMVLETYHTLACDHTLFDGADTGDVWSNRHWICARCGTNVARYRLIIEVVRKTLSLRRRNTPGDNRRSRRYGVL